MTIVGDLLLSKGTSKFLEVKSKPIIFIAALKDQILAEFDKLKGTIKESAPLPRWFRLNTLLSTPEELREQFESDGWWENAWSSEMSYEEFLQEIEVLNRRCIFICFLYKLSYKSLN